MNKIVYNLALWLTIAVAIISFITIFILKSEQLQTILASISGGALSLAASMLVQKFASSEQSQMIKSVTLDAEGVSELPASFRELKWLIYATTKTVMVSHEATKTIQWKFTKLRKLSSSGPSRFAVYNFSTTNLVNEPVSYTITFIGSRNTVVGLVTKENESTSTITFDVHVPDAGVWFGSAYATDWTGDRILTMAITGVSDSINDICNLPEATKSSFIHWNKKVNWDAKSIFEEFNNTYANN